MLGAVHELPQLARQRLGRPGGRAADQLDVRQRGPRVVQDVVHLHQPDLRVGDQHVGRHVGPLRGVARNSVRVDEGIHEAPADGQQGGQHALEEGHVVSHDHDGHWQHGRGERDALVQRLVHGAHVGEGDADLVGQHGQHLDLRQVVDDHQVRLEVSDLAEEGLVAQHVVAVLLDDADLQGEVLVLAPEVAAPRVVHGRLLHVDRGVVLDQREVGHVQLTCIAHTHTRFHYLWFRLK